MLYIKAFEPDGTAIGVEKHENPVYVRWQSSNQMVVRCEKEQAQGIVAIDGNTYYLIEGFIPTGERLPYFIEITEEQYNAERENEEDEEDETPEVPEGTDASSIPTRAELAERVATLEQQNEFLSDCLLEISETVYA